MYIYYKYTVVVSVYKTDSSNLYFELVTILFDRDTNCTIEMTCQSFPLMRRTERNRKSSFL